MFFSLVLAVVLFSSIACRAQRNAKEEAICAPFLTSPKSSPLIEGLERNLKYDEDAEFSCELVLQDVELPMQIRLTIHEGLYYLAVRHLQLGLHRERTAARHAKHLAAIVPSNFQFQRYLGMWSVHHEVSDPETAVNALFECLYGKAANDKTIANKDIYLARRDYITALLALDRKVDAMVEVKTLLENNPFDFEAAFLWKTYQNSLKQPDSWLPKETEELQKAISNLTSLHTVSIPDYDHCTNEVASNLRIIRTNHMVTPSEFDNMLNLRIPVKILGGDIKTISESLHWKIHENWFEPNSREVNLQYLKDRVGDEEEVLVESTRFIQCDHDPANVDLSSITPEDYNKPCVTFGLSLGARRKSMLFHKLVDQHFQDLDSAESFYLNVQNSGSGQGPYRPPLHLLQDDLPLPTSDTFLRQVRENITDINLWMSETRLQSLFSPHPHRRPTASRLHRDANDNLYIVLEGEKRFAIWHPCSYRVMQTLSPSYHVNADGLPTQFNVNAFKRFVKGYVQNQFSMEKTLQSISSKTGLNTTTQQEIDNRFLAQESFDQIEIIKKLHPLLQRLLSSSEEDVDYETLNLHFSQLSSHTHGSTALPPPTSIVTVKPGEMLYLPTGWFHEVTSMPGRQVAINVWWKPPHWESAKQDEEKAQQRLFEGLMQYFQASNKGEKNSDVSFSIGSHMEL